MALFEVKVPAAGESVSEGEIAKWRKKDGDAVKRDEILADIETDKATLEVRAETEGALKILVPAGKVVKVGAVIATVDPAGKGAAPSAEAPAPHAAPPKAPASPKAPAESKPAPEGKAAPAHYAAGTPSPSAERILAEKGVAAASVIGTGKDGRITAADALAAAAPRAESRAPAEDHRAPSAAPAPVAAPGSRAVRREKMSRLRRTIANRMVEAKSQMALLTTFNEVDMSAVMETRKKYKELFTKKHAVGLGFMSFFTKAAAQALLEFPVLNASMDVENVVYHDYADIGIAVAAPKGLVVPVVRDAQNKNFQQIEAEILELGKKGREGRLTPEEMEGGTFTITNGGVFGSMLSTPIVNRPQSAILGMHNIVERPVAVNGQVVIRPVMYLALTYDHRIIDGADSVRFLVRVKEMIEDPVRLMLGV